MFAKDALQKIQNHRDTKVTKDMDSLRHFGRVTDVIGTIIEAALPGVPLGALVEISQKSVLDSIIIEGEVVGFKKDKALIVPFGDPAGICADSLVRCVQARPKIRVGDHLIGRVVDSYLKPLTGPAFAADAGTIWDLHRDPINPLLRRRIHQPLDLGVRALNGLLTCGEGQRLGIMAGSGVGKSVLLGMIAKYTEADVNIIGLVGERGREVREFLEDALGTEGLKRSVVVVSTSDQSPLSRIRAAHVTTAIAERFRESGKKVLLMLDSLTRVAMAQREIGLAVGEPPTTKGYTPSVFSMLPRLLERAGNSASAGSITGIYTVLVDGDDFNDPISDTVRSILDGHINLTRDLASRNHFPAIEITSSASRVMVDVASREHQQAAGNLRELLSSYAKAEDAISLGVYNQGSNPKIDRAIRLMPKIEAFLRQDRQDFCGFAESIHQLTALVNEE